MPSCRIRSAQRWGTAQLYLGQCYVKGEGVPKDFVLGYAWRNLAAARGVQGATKARDTVARKMSPQQIAEAQRYSREWQGAFQPVADRERLWSPLTHPDDIMT